jgi:AAA domain-containing protein
MLDIVARVTKGEKFPDGSENTLGARRVLLAATEDDLESTLVPRLMAAGADITKVVILKRVEVERAKGGKNKKERRILQLKADANLLRFMLKKNPDIALVALDPISSYFGDADPNKDKEIRPVMEAVAEACDQSGVSFVAIIHNNKRGDADAIGKILGASSVVGVSRAVWGFAHDPEDNDKKYMTLVKGNLARNRKGMKYRIADATVVIKGKDRVLPRIEWMEETDASANDVLDMQRDSSGRKDAKKIDMIKLLLQKQLDETPGNAILLRDFYSLCEKERLGDGDKIKKTVQRAVKDIGATTAKPPNSKGPWWIMMDIDAQPWVAQFEADGKDSKGHEQPKGWAAEAI